MSIVVPVELEEEEMEGDGNVVLHMMCLIEEILYSSWELVRNEWGVRMGLKVKEAIQICGVCSRLVRGEIGEL